MKDTDRRCLEMFIGVREFGQAHAAQFLPTSFAVEQFAIVDPVINALEKHTRAQESGKGALQERYQRGSGASRFNARP